MLCAAVTGVPVELVNLPLYETEYGAVEVPGGGAAFAVPANVVVKKSAQITHAAAKANLLF